MDLQLPIISGIEASQTIRKLESIKKKNYYNKPLTPEEKELIQKYPISSEEEDGEEDEDRENGIQNSKAINSFIPCIIVALTASNTLEDKNLAINSGCNDYLTKPVNLVWLSNKLMEWGYMQSLMTS